MDTNYTFQHFRVDFHEVCNFIPVVSTFTCTIAAIQKRIFESEMGRDPTLTINPYYQHLRKQDFEEDWLLFIPLANFCFAIAKSCRPIKQVQEIAATIPQQEVLVTQQEIEPIEAAQNEINEPKENLLFQYLTTDLAKVVYNFMPILDLFNLSRTCKNLYSDALSPPSVQNLSKENYFEDLTVSYIRLWELLKNSKNNLKIGNYYCCFLDTFIDKALENERFCQNTELVNVVGLEIKTTKIDAFFLSYTRYYLLQHLITNYQLAGITQEFAIETINKSTRLLLRYGSDERLEEFITNFIDTKVIYSNSSPSPEKHKTYIRRCFFNNLMGDNFKRIVSLISNEDISLKILRGLLQFNKLENPYPLTLDLFLEISNILENSKNNSVAFSNIRRRYFEQQHYTILINKNLNSHLLHENFYRIVAAEIRATESFIRLFVNPAPQENLSSLQVFLSYLFHNESDQLLLKKKILIIVESLAIVPFLRRNNDKIVRILLDTSKEISSDLYKYVFKSLMICEIINKNPLYYLYDELDSSLLETFFEVLQMMAGWLKKNLYNEVHIYFTNKVQTEKISTILERISLEKDCISEAEQLLIDDVLNLQPENLPQWLREKRSSETYLRALVKGIEYPNGEIKKAQIDESILSNKFLSAGLYFNGYHYFPPIPLDLFLVFTGKNANDDLTFLSDKLLETPLKLNQLEINK